jgi:hypothetical protein
VAEHRSEDLQVPQQSCATSHHALLEPLGRLCLCGPFNKRRRSKRRQCEEEQGDFDSFESLFGESTISQLADLEGQHFWGQ